MNEIFGVSISTFMVVLLGLLGLALLSVVWVAVRRPVIFKLGVRNIPRRKAQTILTVTGLMLSTLIISAAFGTGDTLDHSLTDDAYDSLGHVDELVVASRGTEVEGTGMGVPFPARGLGLVEQGLSGSSDVDGIMPILEIHVPATAETSRQSEPDVVLTGVDPGRLDAFGGLTTIDGEPIDLAALPDGSVVISELAAETLGLAPGDTVSVFYQNEPQALTVAAITGDSYLTGVRRDMAEQTDLPGMIMALDRLQAMTGQADTITGVLISNAGGVRDSLGSTDSVVSTLGPLLEGTGLGISPIKDDRVDAATSSAQMFTGLFLIFGLFSIAVGILLIVLIFSMLAAERRAEMGMERAIGAQRRQLVQQFISEGTIYALLAGLVGVTFGVLAAAGIARVIGPLVDDATIEWSTSATSVIVSYCLGVGITFLSVVLSSWRISRLTIVTAIRDIPDVTTLRRKARSLIGAGVLLIGGAGMLLLGMSNESAFPFRLGLSLLPFGVALALRYAGVPSRLVFSLVAVYLLGIWLLPTDTFDRIFGEYEGDFELFFLSGIFLVLAATILVMQNTALLLRGVGALGGLLQGRIASLRTAIAYPSASPVRTGMTIAMFCLIVFALVMTATMSGNFRRIFLSDDANAGWDIRADVRSANAIDNVTAALERQGVDTSRFTAVGMTTSPTTGPAEIRTGGTDQGWESFPVAGMDDAFLDGTTLFFQQYAAGYGSDEAVLNALRTEPGLAVVSADALPLDGPPVNGMPQFEIEGITADSQDFAPIVLELAVPGTDEVREVRVIGVIDSRITALSGLFMSQETFDGIYPSAAETSYYIALDGGDANAAAHEIEGALLTNGAQAISIRDVLEENQSRMASFFAIVQGFMGLGLFVGIAAIGVIAFRSVVERRQQIGVLRAIGYQRSEVALSFLIETAFIVSVGVIGGTMLGLILARNLFRGDELGETAETFVIPWGTVSVILIATVLVALLMTWIPARQASRIAPAEALRYE